MATLAANKKYVTLSDVRVSYRKSTDSIYLVSTDEDFSEGFHLPLSAGTKTEETLRQLLKDYKVIPSDQTEDNVLTEVRIANEITQHVLTEEFIQCHSPVFEKTEISCSCGESFANDEDWWTNFGEHLAEAGIQAAQKHWKNAQEYEENFTPGKVQLGPLVELLTERSPTTREKRVHALLNLRAYDPASAVYKATMTEFLQNLLILQDVVTDAQKYKTRPLHALVAPLPTNPLEQLEYFTKTPLLLTQMAALASVGIPAVEVSNLLTWTSLVGKEKSNQRRAFDEFRVQIREILKTVQGSAQWEAEPAAMIEENSYSTPSSAASTSHLMETARRLGAESNDPKRSPDFLKRADRFASKVWRLWFHNDQDLAVDYARAYIEAASGRANDVTHNIAVINTDLISYDLRKANSEITAETRRLAGSIAARVLSDAV